MSKSIDHAGFVALLTERSPASGGVVAPSAIVTGGAVAVAPPLQATGRARRRWLGGLAARVRAV